MQLTNYQKLVCGSCGLCVVYSVWSKEIDAQTPASQALAQALKKRGWKFVGPTTAYAFMQSMGMVNDHAPYCVTRAQVAAAKKAFQRPD